MNSERGAILLRHFVQRDFQQRYLGSFSGGAWSLIQPLALLAIYAFVFIKVLGARLPAQADGDFVPFLVTGLWPWVAFSESLNRANTAIQDHAGLLAKTAIPHWILVAAPVLTTYGIHLVGFALVYAIMLLLGKSVGALGLLASIPIWLLLFFLTLGLGFLLAALQVFVRDIAQMLAQVLALWFFMTPVFYSLEMLPERYRFLMSLNPLSAYIEMMRGACLLQFNFDPSLLAWAAAYSAIAMALGLIVFRRLSPHFEDFL